MSKLKKIIYSSVTIISKNDLLVAITRKIIVFFRIINNFLHSIIISNEETKLVEKLSKKISSSNKIIQGPFKGQIFADKLAVGSTYLPKILGTYEIELLPVWEKVLNQDFDLVIDIGCAEGFYAVAMAKHFSNKKVYAFDVDQKALTLCKENALVNNVQNLEILPLCTSEFLENNCTNKKTFIICDIEGGEDNLFKNTGVKCLLESTILIELHDGVKRNISENMKSIFSDTHDFISYFSTDDLHRPKKFHNFNTPNLNDDDLFNAMKENRAHIMEWVLFTPKI